MNFIRNIFAIHKSYINKYTNKYVTVGTTVSGGIIGMYEYFDKQKKFDNYEFNKIKI